MKEVMTTISLHELAMILDTLNRTPDSHLKADVVEVVLNLIKDKLN